MQTPQEIPGTYQRYYCFLTALSDYNGFEELFMIREGTQAQLYLDGHPVGTVRARHASHSWGFGEFVPSQGFEAYAGLFGMWSLMIHADGEEEPLSQAAAEELRAVEVAIDALHARLLIPEGNIWHSLTQLNIDGPLIEWKEA